MVVQFDSANEKTARALMCLGADVTTACNTVERMRLQYNALAERHGLPPCPPGIPS
jgi:hypothetical protein